MFKNTLVEKWNQIIGKFFVWWARHTGKDISGFIARFDTSKGLGHPRYVYARQYFVRKIARRVPTDYTNLKVIRSGKIPNRYDE